MMSSPRRNGVTRIELLIGAACAMTMIAIGTIVVGQEKEPFLKPAPNPKTILDATQLVQIHQAMVIFAGDNEERFPHPGLINRLAVGADAGAQLAGQQIPGMGPEDLAQNTTANLYSVLIAMRFISPEIVISPVERNPKVKLVENYNFDAYNPAEDTYWDSSFKADLKEGANTSYAHQPIVPARREQWSNTNLFNIAQLGNRGPRDGAIDYDSITCGPHGNWAGNITFADNHTEFFTTTSPDWLKGDNLFLEQDRKHDALIAFTQAVKDAKAVLQFD